MSEIYLSYCLNIFLYLTYAMQCKVFSHEILCCGTLHCVLCYITLHYKFFHKITDTAKNFIGRHLLHKLLRWVVITRLNISIFIYELCAAFSTFSIFYLFRPAVSQVRTMINFIEMVWEWDVHRWLTSFTWSHGVRYKWFQANKLRVKQIKPWKIFC